MFVLMCFFFLIFNENLEEYKLKTYILYTLDIIKEADIGRLTSIYPISFLYFSFILYYIRQFFCDSNLIKNMSFLFSAHA